MGRLHLTSAFLFGTKVRVATHIFPGKRALVSYVLPDLRGLDRWIRAKTDFAPPRSFDPEQFMARPPWLLGEAVAEACIRVSESLSWWVERSYPRMRREAEQADGSVVFVTPYADSQALVSFALSLGRQVEVLSPPSVRGEIITGLESIMRLHTQGAEKPGHPGDAS